VTTKDIRTSDAYAVCDVCGRTLLRGETAEVYLTGGARRSVCELCTERARNEGWLREGTVPAYDDGGPGSDRRRSLFSRLRGRREARPAPSAAPTLADELDRRSWSEGQPAFEDAAELLGESPAERPRRASRPERDSSRDSSRDSGRNGGRDNGRERGRAGPVPFREPRHVHAVPTNVEQKIASTVDLFNYSEHPRTVAGVARSLGAPTVSVAESLARSSMMHVVVSWELCWYRYEVDLGEERPTVRVADQGYELDELSPEELVANAAADDRGALLLSS
jgi:hypothetical protein